MARQPSAAAVAWLEEGSGLVEAAAGLADGGRRGARQAEKKREGAAAERRREAAQGEDRRGRGRRIRD